MNYKEALHFIEEKKKRASLSENSTGISLGLDRMRQLCAELDDPQDKLQFIHVAGTNGKGSVSAYISSILGLGGTLVGRYVSPVVFEYRECIRFEDARGIRNISEDLLAEVVTETAHAMEQMKEKGMEEPTVFEMETAMAFLAFVKEQCQIVVLEVGLGGREDATNVIRTSVMTVITSISRDHMAFLGDTIESIAREKAGIIKPGVPVVAYPKNETAEAVIRQVCKEKKSPLTIVRDEDMELCEMDVSHLLFSYKDMRYYTQMCGSYQMANASLAIEACRQLEDKLPLNEEQLIIGVRQTYWRGRFEVVCHDPLIVVDGAHNEDGAAALADAVKNLLPDKKIHAVMGVFKDKEYEKMVSILQPLMADVVTVKAPGPRGLPAEELADVWEKAGCTSVSTAESVSDGLKKAMNRCEKEDTILLFGSLSLLSQLKWRS